MKQTLRMALEEIAAIYKWRDQTLGNYMYNYPKDRGKTGQYVMLYAILEASNGKTTLYELNVGPKVNANGGSMSVQEWSDWLKTNASDILKSRVLSFMSARHGGQWRVRGIVGWRFMLPPKKKAKAAPKRPQGGGRKGE